MTTSEIGLRVNKERLSVTIIRPKKKLSHLVLFLFGGSLIRGKERFAEWQKKLAQKNISSVSFDYSGTGKSTGKFFASSLANRINETAAIIHWLKENFGPKIKLTLCGGSMGAYIALGVSIIFPKSIKNLILFCPAAYAKESHLVCLGPEFTACIQKQNSWKFFVF
jgi:pimeloyl-ACP methyl ester carboxylesterase